MSRVSHNLESTVRQCAVQLPGRSGRTDHVVPALHYVHRDGGELPTVLKDIAVLQEDSVHEVVAFNPREGSCEVQVVSLVDVLGVWDELGGTHLPEAPLLAAAFLTDLSEDVSLL